MIHTKYRVDISEGRGDESDGHGIKKEPISRTKPVIHIQFLSWVTGT